MTLPHPYRAERRPKIVMTEADHVRLTRLAEAAASRMPEVSEYLSMPSSNARRSCVAVQLPGKARHHGLDADIP